jgi:hypothetical protein
MYTKMQSRFIFQLLTALALGSLILSACASAVSTPTPHGDPLAPTETSAPIATLNPTVVSTPDGSLQFSLETGSMATGFQTESISAVSAGSGAPYWEILPEYTRATLQGYPLSSHAMQPQIFIYPVEELGKTNEGAGKEVASLQTLLQSPQEIPDMPFLPLVNARQVMQPQVQYLDFKNGKGLRYLTQFNQGIVPINNTDLLYTFQGLTSDGKYYVAALLPVNHPSLPADGKITGNEPPEFMSDHSAFLTNVAKDLNVQAANTFTPDLTQLDEMLSSLEIK